MEWTASADCPARVDATVASARVVASQGGDVSVRTIRGALIAGGALAAVVLAACGTVNQGGPSPTSSPSASGADPAIAALVPTSVSHDGKLLFGVDASYPPNEYTQADGRIVGWGTEIGSAVARLLGLQAEFKNVTFDRLISDVRDGRYELGLGSITITPARSQLVDLVSYYRAGTSWAVAHGDPTGMTQNDACGRTVAVLKGSVQFDDLTARSTLCTRASRAAIVVEPFQRQTDATAAVLDGSADAVVADSPVIASAVAASNGKLQPLGDTYRVAPYGVAVPKGSGDLAVAVRRAVQKLIDSGQYAHLLQAASVEDGAIHTSLIYPPAR